MLFPSIYDNLMVNSYDNWVTCYNLQHTYEKVTVRYSNFAIQTTGACFIQYVILSPNKMFKPL